MGKTLFGGTTQQIFMGLAAALLFIMAIEASQLGFGGGFGFFGWDGSGNLGWHGASVREEDGVTTIRVNEQGCKLKLEQRGEVTISEDERDVAALSSDGHLQLELRGCGDKFELEAKGGGAAPAISAKLRGQDVPWDDATRTRFHEALQLIYETTAFDAAGRVDRLYRKGGAAAVLEAAGRMRSDWVQRFFLQTLLGKQSLTADDAVATWRLAGEKLGSDYELSQLIHEAPHPHSADPRVQAAIVDALRSIGSDYELRRSLDFLLERGGPALVDQLLAVAADKISSDYEQAEFLIAVGKKLPPAEPLPPSFDRALDSVNSDYELRRSLEPLVLRESLSRADLERLLQVAVENLSSDHEMTEFLITVAEHQKKAEPWPPGLRRAIAEIGSDHDENRVREAFGTSLEAAAPAVEQVTAAD